MNVRRKLLLSVLSNPRDVSFHDACKIAGWLGFVRAGGKGSHVAHARRGEPIVLNFQNRGGRIAPYPARQPAEMIERYGDRE